jgi:hypothetical protein
MVVVKKDKAIIMKGFQFSLIFWCSYLAINAWYEEELQMDNFFNSNVIRILQHRNVAIGITLAR